jgi:hypothetical protein
MKKFLKANDLKTLSVSLAPLYIHVAWIIYLNLQWNVHGMMSAKQRENIEEDTQDIILSILLLNKKLKKNLCNGLLTEEIKKERERGRWKKW